MPLIDQATSLFLSFSLWHSFCFHLPAHRGTAQQHNTRHLLGAALSRWEPHQHAAAAEEELQTLHGRPGWCRQARHRPPHRRRRRFSAGGRRQLASCLLPPQPSEHHLPIASSVQAHARGTPACSAAAGRKSCRAGEPGRRFGEPSPACLSRPPHALPPCSNPPPPQTLSPPDAGSRRLSCGRWWQMI